MKISRMWVSEYLNMKTLNSAPAAVLTMRNRPMNRPMNSTGTVSLNRQWKTDPTNMSKNLNANMKIAISPMVRVAGDTPVSGPTAA
jgi:hypothetical protein